MMRPKEIIKKWVDAFNATDVDVLAEFYADHAVNHQVPSEPVEGKKAIKEMFKREFSQTEMVCIIENIFEDGDWGILEWKDPLGLRGCSEDIGTSCLFSGNINCLSRRNNSFMQSVLYNLLKFHMSLL